MITEKALNYVHNNGLINITYSGTANIKNQNDSFNNLEIAAGIHESAQAGTGTFSVAGNLTIDSGAQFTDGLTAATGDIISVSDDVYVSGILNMSASGENEDHKFETLVIQSGAVYSATSGLTNLTGTSGTVFDNNAGSTGYVHNGGTINIGYNLYGGDAIFYNLQNDLTTLYVRENITVINYMNHTSGQFQFMSSSTTNLGNSSQAGTFSAGAGVSTVQPWTSTIQGADQSYPAVINGGNWWWGRAGTKTFKWVNFTINLDLDDTTTTDQALSLGGDVDFARFTTTSSYVLDLNDYHATFSDYITMTGNITGTGNMTLQSGASTINNLANFTKTTIDSGASLTLGTNSLTTFTDVVGAGFDGTGTLTATGTSGNEATIQSAGTTNWDVNSSALTETFNYANVAYGNNTGLDIIYVYNGTDSGNNIPEGMWVFNNPAAPDN